MSVDLVDELRKAAKRVFLAAPAPVAEDLASKLNRAADMIERLRGDNIKCHYQRDILDSLSEAMTQLPACGMLAIVGAASQDIQALRQDLPKAG